MIRQWYSARELADFNLTKLPFTLRGLQKLADREGWKWRPRQASGGGKEYHISNLPDASQIELIEAAVGQQCLKQLESKADTLQMSQERGRAKFTTQERTTARIAIVSLFDNFRASCGLGVLAAERPFIKLYMAEKKNPESDIIPSWIFEIYPDFTVLP